MDYVERNYKILEDRMIEEMNTTLQFGRTLIDSELKAGVFNIIVKPLVKTFYDTWSNNAAKVGTLKQIKTTLDCAKQILQHGSSQELFDDLINNHFQEYIEGDQTYIHCRKKHENFDKLKEINKKLFIIQVKDAMKMMQIKQDINNYDELTKIVFKTKQDAYISLIKNIDYNDEAIKLIEKDPSILKLPTAKKIILKTIRKGFEKTKLRLIQYLDTIYN